MTQLKKIFLGLAVVVALGFIGANNASAQVSCTANSVPTLVRSQGIAELTGSIVLNCTATAATAVASLTVTVQPSAAVITNNPATPGAVSAACTSGTQTAPIAFIPTITTQAGTVAPTGAPATCVGIPSGNTITFPTLAVPAAGTFTVTIGVAPGFAPSVGIRANVFASGITFPAQIAALLTSSPAGVIAVTNNFLNVAIPQNGLVGSIGGPTPNIATCTTPALKGVPTTLTFGAGTFVATDPVTSSTKAPSALATVSAVEGFASAFQIGGVLGEGADSTQGTRILISLSSLPSNVILVAANDIKVGSGGITAASGSGGTTMELVLIPGADTNGNGAGPANPAIGLGATQAGATVLTGSTVTYEVAATAGPVSSVSNAIVDGINIPIGIYTIGTPTPFGTSTASVQLGPVSTVGTAISNPIPRFGAAPASGNFLIIVPCLTNVFVPWAANTAGYDTGFAIANTTTDIFGTASQSGTCVYNFFGTNPPSGGTFTTPAFGGGTVDTRILSTIAPGFFGYIIVQCNFQMGHGFEFIVNGFGGGAPTVGEGGEALIIVEPTTIGTGGGSRKAAAGLGEVLGH